MVKLFITPACPYCFTLKEFLKEHNIDFEEIDISQNEKARDEIIKKSGQIVKKYENLFNQNIDLFLEGDYMKFFIPFKRINGVDENHLREISCQ